METKEEVVAQEAPEVKGKFMESLTRNNKKIRADRALAISEDTQMIYKRKIEDMITSRKRLKRERENMLDLSPTTGDSLVLASDFKSDQFVEKDIQIGVDLRTLEIKLDIAQQQYEALFGEKI